MNQDGRSEAIQRLTPGEILKNATGEGLALCAVENLIAITLTGGNRLDVIRPFGEGDNGRGVSFLERVNLGRNVLTSGSEPNGGQLATAVATAYFDGVLDESVLPTERTGRVQTMVRELWNKLGEGLVNAGNATGETRGIMWSSFGTLCGNLMKLGEVGVVTTEHDPVLMAAEGWTMLVDRQKQLMLRQELNI